MIPEPDDRRPGNAGVDAAAGRVHFDPETYPGRNVVERSCNVVKQRRGIATRYAKLAITHRGDVVSCAITIRSRQ